MGKKIRIVVAEEMEDGFRDIRVVEQDLDEVSPSARQSALLHIEQLKKIREQKRMEKQQLPTDPQNPKP